jgi:flagella basal body P-ring formation protein FlgA
MVPSEEILLAIKDYLIREENLNPKDFEVLAERRMQSVTLPDGSYEMEVKKVSDRAAGPSRFEITVLQENLSDKTIPVSVSVARYETLPTVRQLVPRGKQICETDLEPARLDVSRMSASEYSRLMKTTEGILGKEARIDIPAGRPILSDMLTRPNVIQSGDRVTLVAACGRVRISAAGMAQQDGQEGDTIRVVNLATRKRTYGQVVGPGLVKIQ